MAQTQWITVEQIELSREDGSPCTVDRQKGQIFSRTQDGEDWTDNKEQQLLLGGKRVKKLPDGRYQVAGTNEILTPIRKAR